MVDINKNITITIIFVSCRLLINFFSPTVDKSAKTSLAPATLTCDNYKEIVRGESKKVSVVVAPTSGLEIAHIEEIRFVTRFDKEKASASNGIGNH